MQVPTHWQSYPCDDYFDSEWSERGCWDEPSRLMLVVPAAEVEERPSLSFLVGRPGVDGIKFGYRAGRPGLWAFYPIDREFVPIASTVKELVDRFLSGKLSV